MDMLRKSVLEQSAVAPLTYAGAYLSLYHVCKHGHLHKIVERYKVVKIKRLKHGRGVCEEGKADPVVSTDWD